MDSGAAASEPSFRGSAHPMTQPNVGSCSAVQVPIRPSRRRLKFNGKAPQAISTRRTPTAPSRGRGCFFPLLQASALHRPPAPARPPPFIPPPARRGDARNPSLPHRPRRRISESPIPIDRNQGPPQAQESRACRRDVGDRDGRGGGGGAPPGAAAEAREEAAVRGGSRRPRRRGTGPLRRRLTRTPQIGKADPTWRPDLPLCDKCSC